MLNFKGVNFYLAPKNLSTISEIDFDVFNEDRQCIGTNYSINKSLFNSDNERFEFEDFVDKECQKLEGILKFNCEFNISPDKCHTLGKPCAEIFKYMQEHWSMDREIMERVLPCSTCRERK